MAKKKASTKSATKKTTAKPGRPKGSLTQKVIAHAHPSRCPKCKSTDRAGYGRTRTVESRGTDPETGPYTHVLFRVTKCRHCGQARTDRSFENRVVEAPLATATDNHVSD